MTEKFSKSSIVWRTGTTPKGRDCLIGTAGTLRVAVVSLDGWRLVCPQAAEFRDDKCARNYISGSNDGEAYGVGFACTLDDIAEVEMVYDRFRQWKAKRRNEPVCCRRL